MSSSPVLQTAGNVAHDIGNALASPVRSIAQNPKNIIPILAATAIGGPVGLTAAASVAGADQMIGEAKGDARVAAQNQTSAALAANQAELARQDRLASLGANLAGKGSQDLSSINFTSLSDPALVDSLTSRKNSVLSRREAPGRAQTILASRLRTN